MIDSKSDTEEASGILAAALNQIMSPATKIHMLKN